MNLKMMLGMAVLAVASLGAVGCSDPCGDIKDCCEALNKDNAGAANCAIYDEADSDACDAAIEAAKGLQGDNVPEECKF